MVELSRVEIKVLTEASRHVSVDTQHLMDITNAGYVDTLMAVRTLLDAELMDPWQRNGFYQITPAGRAWLAEKEKGNGTN